MNAQFIVFIVEDDDSIRPVLKHIFEYEGFLVFEAENGIEALAKLDLLVKVGLPDLILTDVQMPLNGENLINALTHKQELKDIPIIPMSAGGMSFISGKKVIAKPLDLQRLIKKVKTAIKKDRARRHLDE